MNKPLRIALAGFALASLLSGCGPDDSASSQPGKIVRMRRLTESQYRNTIADIFGPDIKVAGRFEPIVRPAHQLIATGAGGSAISPAGLEQFDAIGRGVAAQVFDEAHRAAFVKCTPKDAKQPDDACARSTLAPIGRYVFRRKLTAGEQNAFVKMASDATAKAGSFYAGLELSLAAMLVSPNFLYDIETAEPDPDQPGSFRLDNYARASRLSFLLWDTTPNDELLQAAEKGQLTKQTKLEAIATKMIASRRLEAGVRAFFTDMLVFEKFEGEDFAKDPLIYPRFNSEVAKALPEQLLRTVVDELVVRDGDYRNLFTTRRTFMTRVLGPLYSVPVRSGSGWEPYEFKGDSDRSGLLGQAAFLSLYSHSGRSSPTLRGRAIREVFLCQVVPNPPGNVNFKVVQDTSNKALPTARDRLTAHANEATCAGCHKIIDPVGLTLETFDGIGSPRKQENDTAINTTSAFDGMTVAGAPSLGQALAANPAITACVASRALEYATGRPIDKGSALPDVIKGFATDNYRIKALFQEIATMPAAHRVKAPEESKPTQTTMNSTSTGAP